MYERFIGPSIRFLHCTRNIPGWDSKENILNIHCYQTILISEVHVFDYLSLPKAKVTNETHQCARICVVRKHYLEGS